MTQATHEKKVLKFSQGSNLSPSGYLSKCYTTMPQELKGVNTISDLHTSRTGMQRAKKVVSDSPGLVDFVIGLLNSILNLPDGQVKYYEEFNLQKNCEINILLIKKFGGLVEMTFGLVNASSSLPEWQAVKMTFFAPWACVT